MSKTVTAAQGGPTSPGMALTVKVLTGQGATQNGNTASSSTATSPAIAMTPNTAGNLVYGAVTANTGSNFTAGAGTTFNNNTVAGRGTFRSTGTTVTSSTFFGATAPSGIPAGQLSIAVAEIVAASSGSLTEDASSPAAVADNTLTSLTTAAFNPPAGSLLVATVATNGGQAGTLTVTVSDSDGLTWTPLVDVAGNTLGNAGVWIATVPSGTNANPTPAAVAGTTTIPAPGLSAGSTLTPGHVQAVATVPAPAMHTGSTLTPGHVAAAAAIPVPTVAVPVNQNIHPAAVAAAAAIHSPVVSVPARPLPEVLRGAITVEPFDLDTGVRRAPLNWQTVQAIPTFNAAGSWTMTVAATPDVQDLLLFDQGTLRPFGVFIDWNGVYQFTGKAEEVETDRTIGDNGQIIETVTFSGPDALFILAERIAYPDPTKTWALQSVGTVTKTGHPETVIKALVTANCISAGDTARNYPSAAVATDLARGGSCTWKITTPDPANDAIVQTVAASLMDIWRAIAAQSSTPIGITAGLAGDQLIVDCYEPRDLSDLAVFSARLGNLAEVKLDVVNPSANAILMQSNVTGAKFTETGGKPTGTHPHRRIEEFADESAATAAADVTQAQADAVTAGQAQTSTSATAIDLPRLRFGADDTAAGITGYRLGDLVAVDLFDALTYTDIVSSVTLAADRTNDPYTESVTPSIGTTTDDNTITAALQKQLTALERRLRRATDG